MILAGNGLWEAAGGLGLEDVPILRVSFAADADRRAFILAHNKLAESSGWDSKVVEEELKFLFDSDYDFEVTGFNTNDLDWEAAVGDPAIYTHRKQIGRASNGSNPSVASQAASIAASSTLPV